MINTTMNKNKPNRKKQIESVTLMGVTSQCVDFKLHAFLNYQEDIYANVYSFFVRYTDGSTENVQTYDEKTINYYMSFETGSKKVEKNVSDEQPKTNVLDELRKLKSLYDDGVIPEDIYEEQRKSLLEQMSHTEEKTEDKAMATGKIYIEREKQIFGCGSDTVIIIDNSQKYKIGNGETQKYELSQGTHTVTLKMNFKKESVPVNVPGNGKSITLHFKINPMNGSFVITIE